MKQFFEEIRKKGQENKFVKEDIIHAITSHNVEQEVQKLVRSDVVIPNKLGNDKTCQGLRHWRLLPNLKNNFLKPARNDEMVKFEDNGGIKILNQVQDDNAIVVQKDAKDKNITTLVPQCPSALMPSLTNLFPYFPISFSPKKLRRFRIKSGMTFIKQPVFTLAEGATHVDLPPTKVKLAFTLAEVLITLGIIGVVAAITIPGLINNYKAKQLRTKYLKAYSTVAQAFKLMQNDDINTNVKDYEGGEFAKVFARYLNAATICSIRAADANNGEKNSPGCYSYKLNTGFNNDGYKYLSKNGFAPDGYFNNGQLMLQDGTLIFFDDCPERENWKGCLVTVDINGFNQKPNRMGVDFFVFEVLDGTLHTLGDQDTSYRFHDDCDLDKPNQGGWTCSTNASSNSDYFKMVVKKIK